MRKAGWRFDFKCNMGYNLVLLIYNQSCLASKLKEVYKLWAVHQVCRTSVSRKIKWVFVVKTIFPNHQEWWRCGMCFGKGANMRKLHGFFSLHLLSQHSLFSAFFLQILFSEQPCEKDLFYLCKCSLVCAT